MKKKRSIVWKMGVGILVLPILLLAILQSPPGKAWLATTLSKWLSRPANVEVSIGKISGIIPARMQVASVEISDAEGVWLSAKGLHCSWAMKELFSGLIRVDQLGAESIELNRIPTGGKPSRTPRESGGIKPLEVELVNFDIKQLRLGAAVAGTPLEYAVHSGGIRLHSNGELSGSLDVTGDADGRVEVSAPPLGTEDYLLKATAELKDLRKPDFGLRRLSGRADATVSDDGTVITLNASTEAGDLGVDARVARSNGLWGVEFERLAIQWMDVVGFDLAGGIWPDSIQLEGTLSEFDLGNLPLPGMSNFTGQVGGRISVSGSLAILEVAASLDVMDFTTTQAALDELPDLNFHVDVWQREGRLHGESRITNAVSGSMMASMDVPCSFSLQPFIFDLEPSKLTASLKADLDLAILNGMASLNNERIQGRLDSDLVFDGQAEEKLVGHIFIVDGAYEHYDWGVVVRDIQAEWDAGADGLVIKHMTATDGAAGRVAVTGNIGIWQPGIPLELQVDIKKAHLIRRDEVEGMLSGSLRVGNLLSKPSVGGRLVIDRADILLDNIAPPEPRLLADFDAATATNETDVAEAEGELPFTMDINVSMPDQVYVNAAVIDSVWGGKLKLKDAPGGITVAGVIQPRRGYISFIGKKFRLMDDGRIDLDGAVPPSPAINLKAEYERSDIVAQLALVGKLNNPKYTLTSTPAMPEDEILSYVLFGRDTSSISPYQAYQIAAAARQLSGGMSGPGFMYQMRQALSIDTLEWREPDTVEGKSSVAAGKYVGSGLYVEVSTTLESEEGSTGMMAEYEITRHFSVETSTGPQMRPGIGLNWKNDY